MINRCHASFFAIIAPLREVKRHTPVDGEPLYNKLESIMLKKRRIVRIWFLLMLLILAVPQAGAQSRGGKYAFAPASPYGQAIARAEKQILAFMNRRNIPGLSVTVGVAGQTVWSEGFGFADLENRVPVTPLTKFRIGSVSKTLTSGALGLLVERGKLDLDAPVQKYVPDFPKKRWPITTRQVAGHLAGIRHYRNQEFLMARKFRSVSEALEIFKDDTLLFEPGTKYAYSSYGWNLISAVIEGASGDTYLHFMRANVFQPLGMIHTVADYTDSLIAYRTHFYTRTQGGVILNAPYVDNSYKWAGGGFLANTRDLVRFGFAHMQPGFLKKETLNLLETSMRMANGELTHYGMAWRSGKDSQGRRWVGHSGGSVGGTAFLIVFPAQGVVAAILANIGGAHFRDLPQQLAGLFMPQ